MIIKYSLRIDADQLDYELLDYHENKKSMTYVLEALTDTCLLSISTAVDSLSRSLWEVHLERSYHLVLLFCLWW